jgi:hypothetical protein
MEKEDPMKEGSETSCQICIAKKQTADAQNRTHTANKSNKLNKTDQQKPGTKTESSDDPVV